MSVDAQQKPDSFISAGNRLHGRMINAGRTQITGLEKDYQQPPSAALALAQARSSSDSIIEKENPKELKLEFVERPSAEGFNPFRLVGMKFDTASMFTYYNVLRTSQYLAQAFFNPGIDKLNAFKESLDTNHSLWDAVRHGFSFSKISSTLNPEIDQRNVPIIDSSKENHSFGRKNFILGESILFATLAIGYTIHSMNKALNDFRVSLAAEFGKDLEDIGYSEMFQSDNPIIKTERSKFIWKFLTRGAASGGFLHTLTAGVALSSISIGTERTIFYRKSPYDNIVELVTDVQSNYMEGEALLETTANRLQRILQAIQIEQGTQPLLDKEMKELRPTLNKIAKDIIDQKIFVDDVIAIVGNGFLIPNNPQKTANNYAFVEEYGMDYVIDLAKQRKEIQGDTKDRIWEKRVLSKSDSRPDPHDPKSAKVEKLFADRNHIGSNVMSNFGVGRG